MQYTRPAYGNYLIEKLQSSKLGENPKGNFLGHPKKTQHPTIFKMLLTNIIIVVNEADVVGTTPPPNTGCGKSITF